jgi:hypothetical protein
MDYRLGVIPMAASSKVIMPGPAPGIYVLDSRGRLGPEVDVS